MSEDHGKTLTRRRFLKRGAMAAGALTLPCYIPASALGRNGALAPSDRIVMGGIGNGRSRLLRSELYADPAGRPVGRGL